MITLQLDEQEKRALIIVLESYLSDLRYEIADTDSMDYREELKARKALLMKVLDALKASVERR